MMAEKECIICKRRSSVFWWPFALGDSSGEICDKCFHAIRTIIVLRKRAEGDEE